MKRPVLVAVKHNWLERWQSLNHEGEELKEVKQNVIKKSQATKTE